MVSVMQAREDQSVEELIDFRNTVGCLRQQFWQRTGPNLSFLSFFSEKLTFFTCTSAESCFSVSPCEGFYLLESIECDALYFPAVFQIIMADLHKFIHT